MFFWAAASDDDKDDDVDALMPLMILLLPLSQSFASSHPTVLGLRQVCNSDVTS